MIPEYPVLWLATAVVVGQRVYERRALVVEPVRSALTPAEPSAVEKVHEDYITGEIDDAELERRLADALDDRAATIREEVEAVDGVGPTRAAEIAESFESVEAVRRASVDELTDVEHVGESIAVDVQRHFAESYPD